jgi:pimeloyl-ACP methyl ester carboxylesterase
VIAKCVLSRISSADQLHRRARLQTVLVLIAVLAGCDMGSRDTGSGPEMDAGDTDTDTMDAGGDSDTDTDTDTSDDDDDSWQTDDAGDNWDDGTITIEEACGNDCQYVYEIAGGGWGAGGTSYFNMRPGDGVVRAHGVDSARFMFYLNQGTFTYSLYRQRLIADFNLDSTTLDLIDGSAFQYNVYAGTETSKNFTFFYDSTEQELTHTIEFNGRHWTRTLHSSTAPLIMFNYREYPMETWGPHSTLFAHLVAKRYDWVAGGAQDIPIFSPDLERLYTLTVEKDAQDDQKLIIRFPIDSPEPLQMVYNDPVVYGDNHEMSIEYEFDIPVRIKGLHRTSWKVYSMPTFEISVPDVDASVEAIAPEDPSGYTTEPVSFSDGEIIMAGEMDDPEATGPHPVVILLPGWDYQTRLGEIGAVDMYSQLGAKLAAAGYLALRFDARGTGSSTGDLASATVDDLAGDVQTIVDLIGAVEQADASQVFLLAMGGGAHVAAKAARDLGAKVKGLILIAPFARSFREWGDDNYRHYLTNAGFLLIEGLTETDLEKEVSDMTTLIDSIDKETYQAETWRGHTPAAWKSMLDLDLVDDPSDLPPCLIAVGMEDHLILPSMAKGLYDAIQAGSGPEAALCELEGLTHALTKGTAAGLWPEHGAMEAVDEDAILDIVNWLGEQTGGAR